MTHLRDLMTDDHRHCDDLFAAAEKAATGKQWDAASAAFARFRAAVEAHLAAEEQTLFPAFEVATGMTMGPTRVMRMEHEQIRELMGDAARALGDRLGDAYAGYAETLLIMMQQHNMKEENILYPMCDEQLAGEAAALGGRLQTELAAR